MMKVYSVYSESGGATKTTTAVSVAVCLALLGQRVLLCDVDPRAAATKWLGVQPTGEGLHIGAILAEPDPTGWADQLAVPAPWAQVPTLRVLPSGRSVSNREKTAEDHTDARLKLALTGSSAEVVVLDLPNRQGGPLVQAALTASNAVIYAGKADEDGLDGVEGAMTSVNRFRAYRRGIGAEVDLADAGIVLGSIRDTVPTRDSVRAVGEFESAYGDLLLRPFVPERVIVKEARAAGDYYGWYAAGEKVHDAYMALTERHFQ